MESDLRSNVVGALRSRDAMAVENPVNRGTPDVECVDAWFELKWLEQWPVNLTSQLRLWHFTTQQRAWLRRRWRCNRSAYLLLQVGTTHMMFDGETAAKIVGRSTCQQHLGAALFVWSRWKPGELLRWLQAQPCYRTSSAGTSPAVALATPSPATSPPSCSRSPRASGAGSTA